MRGKFRVIGALVLAVVAITTLATPNGRAVAATDAASGKAAASAEASSSVRGAIDVSREFGITLDKLPKNVDSAIISTRTPKAIVEHRQTMFQRLSTARVGTKTTTGAMSHEDEPTLCEPFPDGWTYYLHGECMVFYSGDPYLYLDDDAGVAAMMVPLVEFLGKTAQSLYGEIVWVTHDQENEIAWVESAGVLLGLPTNAPFIYWDGLAIPTGLGAQVVNGEVYAPMEWLPILMGHSYAEYDYEEMKVVMNVTTMYAYGHTPESSCQLHWYDNMRYCPSFEFLAGGMVYSTWGFERVKQWILDGTIDYEWVIQLLNMKAMEKQGAPLDTDLDWFGTSVDTAFMVADAFAIAKIVQNFSWVKRLAYKTTRYIPLPNGSTMPEVTQFLGFVRNRTPIPGEATGEVIEVWWKGVSKHTAEYQARVTGQAAPMKLGKGFVLREWEEAGVKFDGMHRRASDTKKIFVDAKSDNGWFGRMNGQPWFRKDKFDNDIVYEILRQVDVVKDQFAELHWHVESEALKQYIEELVASRIPHVSEYLHIFHTP